MAATSLTADTDEPRKAEEEFLIERERETDLFSDSEREITNAQAPTTEKTTKTMPQKGREGNSHKPNHKPNDNQARETKRPRDDKRERQGNTDPKKARQNAEHASIMEKIDKSKNSIGLLQAHLEKGTCPKSLRHNVRANIMPNEDFKSDISSIKKRAEHDFVGALVKFHHRRVEKLTIKLRKLEQSRKHKRNDMEFTKNVKLVATVLNSSKQSDINKLAMELTTKLTQDDKLLVSLRAQTNNKEVNLICVFSLPSQKRETKGKPP